jgi:hypothetical protein
MSSSSTKFSYSAAVKSRANVFSSETKESQRDSDDDESRRHRHRHHRPNRPSHVYDGSTTISSSKEDFNAEEVRRYLNEYWEAMVNKLIDTERIDQSDLPVMYGSSLMDSDSVSSEMKSGKIADGRDFIQVLQEQLDKAHPKS